MSRVRASGPVECPVTGLGDSPTPVIQGQVSWAMKDRSVVDVHTHKVPQGGGGGWEARRKPKGAVVGGAKRGGVRCGRRHEMVGRSLRAAGYDSGEVRVSNVQVSLPRVKGKAVRTS